MLLSFAQVSMVERRSCGVLPLLLLLRFWFFFFLDLNWVSESMFRLRGKNAAHSFIWIRLSPETPSGCQSCARWHHLSRLCWQIKFMHTHISGRLLCTMNAVLSVIIIAIAGKKHLPVFFLHFNNRATLRSRWNGIIKVPRFCIVMYFRMEQDRQVGHNVEGLYLNVKRWGCSTVYTAGIAASIRERETKSFVDI